MTSKQQKAVALRYPDHAAAPYISALAEGRAAERLIRVAEASDVPVMRDDEMVEVLSIQSVGDFIPEETYAIIASIFAFVAKMERTAYE